MQDLFIVTKQAKPVLKWAGGKSQLIDKYKDYLPEEIYSGSITKYSEPFIGGGAFFFYIIQNFPSIMEYYISDINKDLILVYETIQENPIGLIKELGGVEKQYNSLDSSKKKKFYYNLRYLFNSKRNNFNYTLYSTEWLKRTANIIFLNKTCFNGLFRVNSKGEFNVPFGNYEKPKICDPENILSVSYLLKKVKIHCADFLDCEQFVDDNTFVYFDPPYRPISKTSSFTSYSNDNFSDNDQMRLSEFYKSLSNKGVKLLLSNSDPKNNNANDNFFDELYKDFKVIRISAKRSINSNGNNRGEINELIVMNY